MKVGVLLCDHLDAEVAVHHVDYEERYAALLSPHDLELVTYDLTRGEVPVSTRECDGWMVGGSRRSAHTDEAFIPDLLEFSAAAAADEVPQVGICFGHQVLARALGGTVARASSFAMGVRHYDLVEARHPAAWMSGSPESFALIVSHQDQVERLPPDAEVLATADYCPVAAYRVGDHVFGVQGHPEFDPGLSATLAERRRAVVGDETVDRALATLGEPVDGDLVADWIGRFLLREV